MTTRADRRYLVLGALAALWLAGCPGRDSPPAQAPATAALRPPVRLVVLVVVDQLPSWSFEAVSNRFDGGFARLLREGVVHGRADVPYGSTYTAPGHAALATGAPPAITGILANYWIDAATGAKIDATADPDSPILAVDESRPVESKGGASSLHLRADGVADVLERESGGAARTVAIALKDRSALLVAGRRPDLPIWYDSEQLAMVTSRAYTQALPEWLRELAREHPIAPRLDMEWTPLPGVDHAGITGIADAQAGEEGDYELGNTFPYRASRSKNPPGALRSMPLGDDIVLETALAAIEGEGLGADDVPDFLAVSFSAHDYACHNWGQESWERLDLVLRLDDEIGVLLEELDRRVGPDRYAVILTSDHGSTRMIEHSAAAGHAARRIKAADICAAAEKAAAGVLGAGTWTASCTTANLYATPEFRGRSQEDRDKAMEAMMEAILAIEGVSYAAPVERIAGDCNGKTGVDARMCWSVIAGLSGEIVFAPEERSLIITSYLAGTSHGAPTVDDSTIPIIVRAPGWAPRTVTMPVSMLQVAPTLAALLGVPAPPAALAPALSP